MTRMRGVVAGGRFRSASHAMFPAGGQDEVPRDFERTRIGLHQHVVHHAHRILPVTADGQARPVRHSTGPQPRRLNHSLGGDHRHRRRHAITVQVEVHDIQEIAVRRRLQRRGEHAQRHAPDHRVGGRRILQDGAERLTVRERDVQELLVGRHGEPVLVDVGRHDAGVEHALDRTARAVESDERDLIGRFRRDIKAIDGFRGRWGRSADDRPIGPGHD